MEKVTPDNGITIIENYVKLPATPEKIKEEKIVLTINYMS